MAQTLHRSFIPGLPLVAAALALVAGAGTPGTAEAAAGQGAEPAYRIYVTNERSGTLSVIDGAQRKVIATVPLGKRPRGAKLSPDGRLLYVALSGSPIAPPGVDESTLPPADKGADGIGVVDLKTLQLQRIIRGVSDPEQLAVSHDGKRLVIASEDTGRAVFMDVASGKTLASLKVGGEPEGVTLSPDGSAVYMTSEEEHSVAVIDMATQKVRAQVNVGLRPRFTEFSDDGSRAYVSGEMDGSITVIDTATRKALRTLKLQGEMTRPVGMVVSHDGKELFVATGRGKQLLALDPDTGAIRRQVEVGPRPWGVALSPTGRSLYTANGPSNDVTVVDADSFHVIGRIPVGEGPWTAIVGPVPQ